MGRKNKATEKEKGTVTQNDEKIFNAAKVLKHFKTELPIIREKKAMRFTHCFLLIVTF